MKISKKFLQFEDNPALIIVAGWQNGKVYYAYQGEIVLNKEIEISQREYSDKEGYFETRSNIPGLSPKGGSVYERDKQRIRKKFLDKLSEHTESLVSSYKIKDIYIFSSPEGIKTLKKEFSPEVKKLIKKINKGNYTHLEPNELLELIKETQNAPVKIMKEEARKILDRTKRIFKG
jgi:hypothetical protein